MLVGAASVIVYNSYLSPLGGVFDVYALLPCFILSFATIVFVSLLTKDKSKNLQNDFEEMKSQLG